MIYQLTYTSIAQKGITDTDIKDILEKANATNTALKISGCLVFYKGKFHQILEGNEADVLEIFEKIKKDKRHHSIKLTATNETHERFYKDWGMLFHNISKELTSEEEIKQFKNNLLTLDALTDTTTESEIWFWREIKRDIISDS